jgi:hypothetical protein
MVDPQHALAAPSFAEKHPAPGPLEFDAYFEVYSFDVLYFEPGLLYA